MERCIPYIISYPRNWAAFDLAPCGLEIADIHRFTATHLRSRDVVDGLHRLDNATFSTQEMRMPRWVLFDCGEFPGLVFGFGCYARSLPDYARAFYAVTDRDDAFVPLSMWVAIRCAEDSAWFGHNLSSANVILRDQDSLPGLAVLTKCLGVLVARAHTLYGATQWDSPSISIHQKLGDLEILCAYTPAHTHAATFAYRTEIDATRLHRELAEGFTTKERAITRSFAVADVEALIALQQDLEAGTRYTLVRTDSEAETQRSVHLRELQNTLADADRGYNGDAPRRALSR
jgi:hypothetical protein